jgi:hypothetical protein
LKRRLEQGAKLMRLRYPGKDRITKALGSFSREGILHLNKINNILIIAYIIVYITSWIPKTFTPFPFCLKESSSSSVGQIEHLHPLHQGFCILALLSCWAKPVFAVGTVLCLTE